MNDGNLRSILCSSVIFEILISMCVHYKYIIQSSKSVYSRGKYSVLSNLLKQFDFWLDSQNLFPVK